MSTNTPSWRILYILHLLLTLKWDFCFNFQSIRKSHSVSRQENCTDSDQLYAELFCHCSCHSMDDFVRKYRPRWQVTFHIEMSPFYVFFTLATFPPPSMCGGGVSWRLKKNCMAQPILITALALMPLLRLNEPVSLFQLSVKHRRIRLQQRRTSADVSSWSHQALRPCSSSSLERH